MKHSQPRNIAKRLQQARKPRRTRHKWPICEESGKRRYRDLKAAKFDLNAAHYTRATAQLNGLQSSWTVIREYYCDHCRGWHLTSRSLRTWAS